MYKYVGSYRRWLEYVRTWRKAELGRGETSPLTWGTAIVVDVLFGVVA